MPPYLGAAKFVLRVGGLVLEAAYFVALLTQRRDLRLDACLELPAMRGIVQVPPARCQRTGPGTYCSSRHNMQFELRKYGSIYIG